MQLSKDTNSETQTTELSLLKILSLIILVFIVIAGGDSYASTKKIYKLIVARPGSNVTTIMRVYAENKVEAVENTALNNWQIINVIDPDAPEPSETEMRGEDSGETATTEEMYSIIVTKVGEGMVEPEGTVSVTEGDSLMLKFIPGPCEKIGNVIYNGTKQEIIGDTHLIENISSNGSIVTVFSKNGNNCEDNGILSANLKELGMIYFDLGKYEAKITDDISKVFAATTGEKDYVIIGHTDDVKVVPNKSFEDNFQLSSKRAKFLLDHLIGSKVKAENVKVIGLGPAFPAAPNKKEGQPLNRRAVLYERLR